MSEKAPQKSQQIYQMLRRAIVSLQMRPGSPVSEKEIAARQGISRTPVREAIMRLADEGLIDVVPHSGTYVSKISFQGAEEGFIIRRALEIEGVRRAALSTDAQGLAELDSIIREMRQIIEKKDYEIYIDADDALHHMLARLSGVTRLWKFINMAKIDLDRMRQLSASVPRHLEEVTEQHAQIVAAVRSGSPDQAELSMRVHLDSSFDVMAGLLKNGSELFAEEGQK